MTCYATVNTKSKKELKELVEKGREKCVFLFVSIKNI
jgi:RNase P/RNase MRP subunit p30